MPTYHHKMKTKIDQTPTALLLRSHHVIDFGHVGFVVPFSQFCQWKMLHLKLSLSLTEAKNLVLHMMHLGGQSVSTDIKNECCKKISILGCLL